MKSKNEHVTVKLERDPSGQVIKEWQMISGLPVAMTS